MKVWKEEWFATETKLGFGFGFGFQIQIQVQVQISSERQFDIQGGEMKYEAFWELNVNYVVAVSYWSELPEPRHLTILSANGGETGWVK